MKLIKLSQDHYIIVDETEIKMDDWYLDDTNTIRYAITEAASYWAHRKHYKKVTHSTQPLGIGWQEEVKELSLSEVKKLIDEVYVKEMAINSWEGCDGCDANDELFFINGYQKGYNQAIEDNKNKKYTEEDLRKAMGFGYDMCHQKRLDKWGFENFIKSLQPKTEWEVEFIDGKLKLI